LPPRGSSFSWEPAAPAVLLEEPRRGTLSSIKEEALMNHITLRNSYHAAAGITRCPVRASVLHVDRHGARRGAFLVVLLAVALTAGACASTPQRIAFDTLQTLRTSVEGYVTVFNAGYQAGTYNDAQRDALGALYGKWKAADTAAALVIVATVDVQASTEGQKVAVAVRAILDFVNSLKGPVTP
jgi:hypothetical protein